jgi:hypothetical protein
MMETPVSPCPCPAHMVHSSMTIHTTLYDLIAALSAEVQPDDDAVLTAVVIHLLETHRVICTGNQARYRLVWDGGKRAARAAERDAARSLFSEL